MNSLKVLDVTLRDGGCVNNFDFGTEYMNKILQAQEKAGLDIIELGYIDEKKGSEIGRTQFVDEKVVRHYFLKKKKVGTKYVVMMDYGKFNVNNLESRVSGGIDGIRLAFHKKDARKAIENAKIIIAKHRNGPLGDVAVKWIGSITTFVNLERDANAQSLENLEPPTPKNTSANAEEDLPEIVPLDDSDITDIF